MRLAPEPAWSSVSHTFEHNNVAALALDPNDPASNTLWAGTGEPNACGSGCTAGVGLYSTTNGGKSWKGPDRRRAVRRPRRRSIAVQPGNSHVDLRGLRPRRPRRVEHLLRRRRRAHSGRAALRPVSVAGRRQQLGARQPGRAGAVHRVDARSGVTESDAVLAARRAARDVRPGGPEHGLRLVLRTRHLAVDATSATPGSRSCRARSATVGNAERAEFDVVQLGDETRMYVGVGGGGIRGYRTRFRRNDAVRSGAGRDRRSSWIDLTSNTSRRTRRAIRASATATASARTTTTSTFRRARTPTRCICRRQPVQREQLRHRALERPRPCCCPPTPASTSPT